MDQHSHIPDSEDLSYWGQHRFLLMISMSIIIALTLVGISMTLYVTSGAAQLDLSRPGYRAVSDQVVSGDTSFENYSATGDINQDTLNEFRALYEKQADKAKAVDAFNGDPLNPDVLELSAPTAE
jgi:hypothetical protein